MKNKRDARLFLLWDRRPGPIPKVKDRITCDTTMSP